MTVEQFREAFAREISDTLRGAQRRYGATDQEMAAAFYASVKKYLSDSVTVEKNSTSRAQVGQFLSSLNLDDLCLAVACAKGDEAAWEDFFRDYRSYLLSVARTMTSDASAAEQLADSTFAELYGLRESEGARISKFSFYSGRGSLRGWLRAVVFQLSADAHRQTSRFVQPEETDDLDKLARVAEPTDRRVSAEASFIRERYKVAVSDALRRAIDALEPRERLLLAYYYYDEMTLREIGRLFDVHEATISRWLTKVQKRTRKLVEKSLARDHRFNRREVAEAIQLAAEEMDISVREYLFDCDRPGEGAGQAVAPR